MFINSKQIALTHLVEKKLQRDNSAEYSLTGQSMQPIFHAGCKAKIEKKSKFTVGDVVMFKSEKEHIFVHRIVARKKEKNMEKFLIKGDSNFTMDGWYSPKSILGTITQIQYSSNKPLLLTSYKARISNCGFAFFSLLLLRFPKLIKLHRLFYTPVISRVLYKILY